MPDAEPQQLCAGCPSRNGSDRAGVFPGTDMIRILVLVALVLSCACPANPQRKTLREQAGLHGPVRTIRLELAKVSDSSAGSVEGPRVVLSDYSYDKNGNVIAQTVNSSDGSRRYKYGWGHTYDTQGREIRTDYYNADGVLTSSGITIYDDMAHTAHVSQHNPNGSVNHIRELFFDDQGNEVRRILRYRNGGTSESSFIYNAQGQPTEFVLKDLGGNLNQKVFSSYDDHGNLVEMKVERADGRPQQQLKKNLRYDDNGNVVEEVNYRPDGSVKCKEIFTYEFDSHGNWTRRTTVRELLTGKASTRESEITYRHITYF